MSLENNIERIANALELIAQHVTSNTGEATPEKKPRTPRAEKPVVDAPPTKPVVEAPPENSIVVAPLETKTVEAPPTQVTPPPVTAPTMTAEELNDALVIEFHRLGSNRVPIDEEMAKLGVSSVLNLPVEQYAVLLANVKARAA